MRLGLSSGYVLGADIDDYVGLAVAADEIGYDVVWAAEAYGTDVPSVLAFLAARTERIDVGAAVMQIPARSAAMTAMTASSLDLLSGGRFRLGLGVSGPQVSEGWHGVRFDRPLARTREYVEVVRKALRRERLTYDGEFVTLPLPDGPGKALKLSTHPLRTDLPIYLAAVGPRNLELTGEIADGWHGIFFSPEHAAESQGPLHTGRERAGRSDQPFDVSVTVPVVIGADPVACADLVRPYAALYVGGMGSREQNFYNRLAVRMGYADAAAEIQDAYLDGRHRDAMAAVPYEFIDRTSLLGPVDRIGERLHAYAEAGVTTVSVSVFATDLTSRVDTLRQVATALERSGLGD